MENNEDREISRLLKGSQTDREQAIILINRYYKSYIWGTIRKFADNMNNADAEDVYQEVFRALIERARTDTLSAVSNIKAYVGGIAHNKTVDRLRKLACHFASDSEFKVDCVDINKLKADESPHKFCSDLDETKFILEIIRKAVAVMPDRQRQVASIICDHLPERISNQELTILINERYGEQVSEHAVKRARQEMETKLRNALIRARKEVYQHAR